MLFKGSAEHDQRLFYAVALWQRTRVAVSNRLTVSVRGIRADAQSDDRSVPLIASAHEPRQPRGATDHERQHTGRERIERSRMTDTPLLQAAPHARDDIVGRGAGRFIDD
jgi:hypothetical protein